MKQFIFSLLLIACALPVTYAVIYRHDVPEEKYRQLGANPAFDCVGKIIEIHTGRELGSCVLIGDRYVLTALHVMLISDVVPDTIMHDGKKITLFNNVNSRTGDISKYHFRFNRRRYGGRSIAYRTNYFDENTRRQCDIALIELDAPVTSAAPAILCNSFDELGCIATGVGYGASGNASVPEDVDVYGHKLAGQNTIDSIGGYLYDGKPALLCFDFDHPEKPQYNQIGSAKPLPLEYMCGGGDSGGGMFRQTKKGWELIGICTGAGTNIDLLMKIGYYGHQGSFTRVSVFNKWIQEGITDFKNNAAISLKK
jgi:hypothetical protein